MKKEKYEVLEHQVRSEVEANMQNQYNTLEIMITNKELANPNYIKFFNKERF